MQIIGLLFLLLADPYHIIYDYQRDYIEETIFIQNTEVYLSGQFYELDYFFPKPVVFGIHGTGRSAQSYNLSHNKGIPFYAYQRKLAIANHHLFIAPTLDYNIWGSDKGLMTIIDIYHDLQATELNLAEEWTFWGTSAGFSQVVRLNAEYPRFVRNNIGTFPVTNITEMIFLDSYREMYITAPTIPIRYRKDQLEGNEYLIFHGVHDRIVPVHQSINFKKKVDGVELILVEGGHSLTNFNLYDEKRIAEFLSY